MTKTGPAPGGKSSAHTAVRSIAARRAVIALSVTLGALLAGLAGRWFGPAAHVLVGVGASALLAALGGAMIAAEGSRLRPYVLRVQFPFAVTMGVALGSFVSFALAGGYAISVIAAGAIAGSLAAKPEG